MINDCMFLLKGQHVLYIKRMVSRTLFEARKVAGSATYNYEIVLSFIVSLFNLFRKKSAN